MQEQWELWWRQTEMQLYRRIYRGFLWEKMWVYCDSLLFKQHYTNLIIYICMSKLQTSKLFLWLSPSLLPVVSILAVQSSTPTLIHHEVYYVVHRHLNNAWHNNAHSLSGRPCLMIIDSNATHKTSIRLKLSRSILSFLIYFAVCKHDWNCPFDKPKCNPDGTCIRELDNF